MKRAVFGDGLLLFLAFTAAEGLRLQRLGRLSLLLPSEALLARPSSVPAFLPLRGPRPPHVLIGASRPPMTPGVHATCRRMPLRH